MKLKQSQSSSFNLIYIVNRMSEENKERSAAQLECLERLRRLRWLDGSMDAPETEDLVTADLEQNGTAKMALEGKGDAIRGIKDLNLVAIRDRNEEMPLKPAVPVTGRVVRATGMEAGAFAAGYRNRIPGYFPVEREGDFRCPHKGCAKVEEFGVFAISKEEALQKMHRHQLYDQSPVKY
jgi:hypothetical protein